ncbi:MAG: hypothetical protein ACI81T_002454 [Bacteroidia bacterium]
MWDKTIADKAYDSFVLSKNSRTKTICRLSFHKSNTIGRYIPRPIFQREFLDGEIDISKSENKVIVNLSKSKDANRFWSLISFVNSYKELVDTEQFSDSFKVVPKDSFIVEFKDKELAEKIEDLKELISLSDLSASDIRSITFEQRKKNIKSFYYLLKNLPANEKISSIQYYREKYKLSPGDEAVWHHFLKKNDWILGLNIDLKIVSEFLDEQKLGIEDSQGGKSPKVDFLGISDFTTLVELKKASTPIFKAKPSTGRGKARANTWEFTADFIEGISQSIGQKTELDKNFAQKQFVKDDNTRLSTDEIQSVDSNAILLIGNKKEEFPINKRDDDNLLKNRVLELFRRNSRNIDILTFDELFERAYQIVYSKKLPRDWYWMDKDELFE